MPDDRPMETVTDSERFDRRQLRRPDSGRILGGVAAGIAEYLDVDVWVVRLVLVALALLGGVGIPLYLAAWLLIPPGHAALDPAPMEPRAAGMRVSDAERGEVADLLSHHYADGRLDSSELEERLGRAMKAKTRGDLAGLLDDLPGSVTEATGERRRTRPVAASLLLLAAAAVLAAGFVVPPHPSVLLLMCAAGAWLWLRAAGHRTHRLGEGPRRLGPERRLQRTPATHAPWSRPGPDRHEEPFRQAL